MCSCSRFIITREIVSLLLLSEMARVRDSSGEYESTEKEGHKGRSEAPKEGPDAAPNAAIIDPKEALREGEVAPNAGINPTEAVTEGKAGDDAPNVVVNPTEAVREGKAADAAEYVIEEEEVSTSNESDVDGEEESVNEEEEERNSSEEEENEEEEGENEEENEEEDEENAEEEEKQEENEDGQVYILLEL